MQKRKIILLVILIAIFTILSWLVATKNPQLISLDSSAINYFDNLRFPALDDFMLAITKIGNVYESLLIFIVSSIILIARRKKYSFYIYTLAVALGSVMPIALKSIFEKARPIGGLVAETTSSFPSGHATISAVFLFSALFIFAPLIKNEFLKWLFMTTSATLLLLVATSRIFLYVHWPSDVLAGFILGTICYLLASIICCHKNENML